MRDNSVSNDRSSLIRNDEQERTSSLLIADVLKSSGLGPERERAKSGGNDALNFLVSAPADSLVASVAGIYGIQSEKADGGKLSFHMMVNGKKIDLALDGDKPLEAQIKNLIGSKSSELEKRFGIKIIAEGTAVANPDARADWRGDKDVAEQKARLPRLDELYAIESSMKSCEPTQVGGKDAKALRFYFLEKPFAKNDASIGQYHKQFGKEKEPAIVIFGNGTKDRPITEIDRNGDDRTFSLQRMIVHELAHHYQFKHDWKGNDAPAKTLEALGWVAPKGDGNGWGRGDDYLLQDKDGNTFKFFQKNSIVRLGKSELLHLSADSWVRTDATGEALDGKAKKILSTAEMAKVAKVTPATNYFVNPAEMHAEALTFFRLNENSRSALLKTDKSLYSFIKEQDQSEIDAVFGKGKKLRSPSGDLVDDNDASRSAVTKLETINVSLPAK